MLDFMFGPTEFSPTYHKALDEFLESNDPANNPHAFIRLECINKGFSERLELDHEIAQNAIYDIDLGAVAEAHQRHIKNLTGYISQLKTWKEEFNLTHRFYDIWINELDTVLESTIKFAKNS